MKSLRAHSDSKGGPSFSVLEKFLACVEMIEHCSEECSAGSLDRIESELKIMEGMIPELREEIIEAYDAQD